MPFSQLTLPFENACCFPPWLRPLEPLCTLSPVRLPVCGLRQSLRMQCAPLHPTSCTLQLMRRYLRLPLSRIYIHCGAKAETVVGLRSMHMGTATSACWIRCRERVGSARSRGRQQWLQRTTGPQVHADFVYGATTNVEAMCCDATLVSPLTVGVALVAARSVRYPELTEGLEDFLSSQQRPAETRRQATAQQR